MEVEQAEDTSTSRIATNSWRSVYELYYPLNTSDANKRTRDIQRKFDCLISRFESIIRQMRLAVDRLKEIVKIILPLSIYFQNIQSFKDFFLWVYVPILHGLMKHS